MPGSWMTFDCYGTLIDWHTGIRQALREAAPSVPPDRLQALAVDYERVEADEERKPYRPYRDVQRAVVRALFSRHALPIPPTVDILSQTLPRWAPYPEVPGVLRRLKDAGWRLGILSNIDRDLMAASLRHLPVPFDLVITAEDVQSYKPAEPHFRRLLEATRTEPGDIWHVAQGLHYDMGVAIRLGFRTVWVNRRGEDPGPLHPDAVVPDLTGVLPVVGS